MSNGNNFHFTFNFHAPVGQQIARVDKLVAQFDKDMTKPLIAACFKNGLICERVGRDNAVLKLMPPLVIPDEQLMAGLQILKKSLQQIL